MSTTEPPTTETPGPGEPNRPRGRWRSRLRSRGVIIGAAVVALLAVVGVAAALLIPRPDDRWGPGPHRSDRVGEGRAWHGGPGGRFGGWGDDDPPFGHGGGPFGLGAEPVLAGSVVSVANGSLVVAVDGGGQRTLRTDDRTRVFGDDDRALGDLQAGERVVVQVQGSGDQALARRVWSPQARVIGTVTAVAGDRATIASVDGLTVTADVAALSQKPVLGDVVVLTGTAADATTLRAEGIRVLPRAS
jgi:hypothetical protein